MVAELPESRHWRPPVRAVCISCALPIADYDMHDGGPILRIDYPDTIPTVKRVER